MQYNITIYSPKHVPFGLLSSHARVPMTIDGRTWNTVTGYVYGNVIDSTEYRTLMSSFGETFLIDAYSTCNRVIGAIRQRAYTSAVLEGTALKLDQDLAYAKKFQTENYGKRILFQHRFKSKTLKSLGDYLTDKLNKLDYVDDKYGLVSQQEIYDVIATAELNSSKITSSSTYQELKNIKPRKNGNAAVLSKKYFSVSSIPSLDQLSRMLVMQFNRYVYDDSFVRSFKTKLLHAYLDSIIEKNYPELGVKDYPLAKQQQLAKLSISEQTDLLNSIYTLYEKDYIPNSVLSRIDARGPPPMESTERSETAKINLNAEKSQNSSMNDEWLNKVVTFDNTYEIHPSYSKSVRDPTSGLVFPTVVHFAYFRVGQALKIPNFKVDTRVPVDSIAQWYADFEKVFVTNRIISLNDQALGAKMKSDISVANILLATGNATISWGDDNDPVLGKSSNATGRWLTRNKSIVKEYLATRSDNNRPVANVTRYAIFRSWIAYKARDYSFVARTASRLNLVKTVPSLKDMLALYNMDKSKNAAVKEPVGDELALLYNSGVNNRLSTLVWSLISTEWADRYEGKPLVVASKMIVDDFHFSHRKLRSVNEIGNEFKQRIEEVYERLGWKPDRKSEFVNSFVRWPGQAIALFKAKMWNVELYY